MTTVRHLERLWGDRQWAKLLRELLVNRPEGCARLQAEVHSLPAAAALAMIRLDELGQTHVPLFSQLLLTLLRAQERDGGWRDPATTALCLRALLIDAGHGAAVDAGMNYLAMLQKEEGAWPREPLRRMPADGFTSALVMFHLSKFREFRDAVRCDDAVRWFAEHIGELDPDAKRLWSLAALRCRAQASQRTGWTRLDEPVASLWSRRCA